jgi:uncharacterized sulfatase
LADDTIVVFVSDHGYHLGHHGLWQKGDLFEGSCRVPMIVADPRGKQGGKSTKAVAEMVDIYPTLADLCGFEKPAHLAGQSLSAVLADPGDAGKEAAYTVAWSRGKGPGLQGKQVLGRTIRTARYRYTIWGDDGEHGAELYDYEQDPTEFTNLARDPAHADVLDQMKELMAAARARAD